MEDIIEKTMKEKEEQTIDVDEKIKKEIKSNVDEKIEEKVITPNEQELLNKYLIDQINNIQFFSNQVKFNQTMYQGIDLILKKLTAIETLLNGNKTKA